MNRRRLTVNAIGLALALVATAPFAQMRSIPDEARRGWMTHVQEMAVEVNGRPVRLAPGAQIRDATNLIVLPSAVPPGSLVKFTVDAQGNLSQVWILSPAEAARRDRRR